MAQQYKRRRKRRWVQPRAEMETLENRLAMATVVARHLFYNHSAFDGNQIDANAADDGAIAIDKVPLVPGQTATFANYSSYSRGINGIMIDVAGLPAESSLDASDFQFLVGNSFSQQDWVTAPSPSQIAVRRGAGVQGSDRVTLIWPDSSLYNTWVQIQMLATGDTGLLSADTFLFGNAIGDSNGPAPSDYYAVVSEDDERLASANPASFLRPAGVANPYDFNRDRYVNATDVIISRNNRSSQLGALRMHQATKDSVRVIYDPELGTLLIESDVPLSSVGMLSKSTGFRGKRPAALNGPADFFRPQDWAHYNPDGFQRLDLGVIQPTNLTYAQLAADLMMDVVGKDGKNLWKFDLIVLPAAEPVAVMYDALSGKLEFNSPFPLASFEILSRSGQLTGDPASNLGGPQDVDTNGRIFKQSDNGFGSLSFGNVLATGLTESLLRTDLVLQGTWLDGSRIRRINLTVVPQVNQILVIYDANTGEVRLQTNAPLEMLRIQVPAGVSVFRDDRIPATLQGPDDQLATTILVKRDPSGFRNVDFGVIGRKGFLPESLAATQVSARLLGEERVIENLSFVVIPEAASTTFRYDANSGALTIDSSLSLTTFQILSAGARLRTNELTVPLEMFDVARDNKLFLLRPAGFSRLELGRILPPGLTAELLARDLSILGSRAGGGPLGAFQFEVVPVQEQVNLLYDANTGEMVVEVTPEIRDLEISSASGIFTGLPAQNLGGPNDVDSDTRILKQSTTGFTQLRLGNVAATGLTQAFLAKDLSFRATDAQGQIFTAKQIVVIPQPLVLKAVYNAATGELRVESNSPLATLDIRSPSGFFKGQSAANLGGPEDIDTDTRIFKRDERGFRQLVLGLVALPGLPDADIRNDLQISATLLDGSDAALTVLEILPDTAVTTVEVKNDGSISVVSNVDLASIELLSSRGMFVGIPPRDLGPNDVDSDARILKQFSIGVRSYTFARVAAPGVSKLFWQEDLTIRGTRVGGGGLGRIQFRYETVVTPTLVIGVAGDGSINVEADVQLASIELRSAKSWFTGVPGWPLGPQDVFSTSRIVKQSDKGFRSFYLGTVGEPGHARPAWQGDLQVVAKTMSGTEIVQHAVLPLPGILHYDPDTGAVRIDALSPIRDVTLFSRSGRFTRPDKSTIYATNIASDRATDLNLGVILPTGLSQNELANELLIYGSYASSNFNYGYSMAIAWNLPQVTLHYDANSGSVSLETDEKLSSISLRSSRADFVGAPAENLNGPNDVDTDQLLLKVDPAGFDDLSFGSVAATAFTYPFLRSEWQVSVRTVDGVELRNFELNVIPQVNPEVVVSYDTSTGEVKLETQALLESLEIRLQEGAGRFAADRQSPALTGPEDALETLQLKKRDSGGFRSLSFGAVALPGYLAPEMLATITAKLVGGADVLNLRWVVIPEGVRTTITYDANTGSLSMDSSLDVTTFELTSASGIFTGEPVSYPLELFDVDRDTKIFLIRAQGVRHVDFGRVARTGLSLSFLENDLSIRGSRLRGGALGAYQFQVIPVQEQVSVTYDGRTGKIVVESSELLTELELSSAAGVFAGSPAVGLGGANDVDTDFRIVKQSTEAFGRLDLGTVAVTALPQSYAANDFTVRARTANGTLLTNVRVLAIPLEFSGKLVYQGANGNLVLESNSPLMSLDIRSASGLLTGAPALHLGGVDDIDTDDRIFKRDARGFRGLDLGQVVSAGWDAAKLSADFTVVGTLLDGSSTGPIAIEVIPDVAVTRVRYLADGSIQINSTVVLDSIELISSWGIFDGQSAAPVLGGPADVDTDTRIYKQSATGFSEIQFDKVARAGLAEDFLKGDLVVRGTRVGGGGIGTVELTTPFVQPRVKVGVGLDGTFYVQSNVQLESIEFTSAGGFFTGSPLMGRDADDVDSDTRVVKSIERGFTDLMLGKIGKAGTSFASWRNDIVVNATRLGGSPANTTVGPLYMVFYYDVDTGVVSIDATEQVSTFSVLSTNQRFQGTRPTTLEILRPEAIERFAITYSTQSVDLNLGAILPAGLGQDELSRDLRFSGWSGNFQQFSSSILPVAVVTGSAPGRLTYDAATGNLSVDTDRPLRSFNLHSLLGIFTGQPAINLGGPNDLDTDNDLTKIDDKGFEDFSLGPVVATGLTEAFLRSDLSVSGYSMDGTFHSQLRLQVIPQVNRATMYYDASSGEVRLETNTPLSALELSLDRGILKPNLVPPALSGPEDVFLANVLTKKDPRGFRGINFGNIAFPGFDSSSLKGAIKATLLDGSVMTDISWVVIPEAAQTTLTYDANTGAIVIDAGVSLTTMELKSASSIFTGEPVAFPLLMFELDRDDKIFLLRPSGMTHLELGRVARPGLTLDELQRDITVQGARAGGGPLGSYQWNVIPVAVNAQGRARKPISSSPAVDVMVTQSMAQTVGPAVGFLQLQTDLASQAFRPGEREATDAFGSASGRSVDHVLQNPELDFAGRKEPEFVGDEGTARHGRSKRSPGQLAWERHEEWMQESTVHELAEQLAANLSRHLRRPARLTLRSVRS